MCGTVTATMKLSSKNSIMYDIDGIIVSHTHTIFYDHSWHHVDKHPLAKKIVSYNKPYLYCLNTTTKQITVKNHIFADWDEIWESGYTLNKLKENYFMKIDHLSWSKDIHTFFDGGFSPNTLITLLSGQKREISEITIGDILANGEIVIGTVIIDGTNVNQYNYHYLGNSFQGGPNLAIFHNGLNKMKTTLEFNKNNKLIQTNKETKLYHLFTDSDTFFIDNIQFYDYNGCIDNLC
jgi:hypothetical protein